MSTRVVSYDGNQLVIKFGTSNSAEFYRILEKVKELYGRSFDSGSKVWKAPATVQNVEKLAKLEFDIKESVFALFKERKSMDLKVVQVEEEKLQEFYPFQVEGVKFLESRKGKGIIADEMGLGKTVQVLGYLNLHSEMESVLVICPASIKMYWRKEIRRWVKRSYKINILFGKKSFSSYEEGIIIINYDILNGWKEELMRKRFDLVIADEVQYVSNEKALRTKAFIKIVRNIENRIFLSGTPIKSKPSEYFTVLNLLDENVFSNRWKYLYRYCDPKHNGFGWVFNGLTNWEELHQNIFPLMIRREKKEVLKDLPEKTKIIVPLECDEIELQKYADASEEFLEWVKEKTKNIEIRNHVEHLKQLAYLAKRNSVMKWIHDYLSTGEKLVVFACHRRVIEDLENEFSELCVRIDGRTPTQDRQAIVDNFQNNEEIKLFVGQIIAAGVGITLTASSATAFVEMGWTPSDHEQAEDRVHRIGQEADAVFAYYLIAEGTIESKIAKLLQRKRKVVGKVLDGKEQEFFDNDILNDLLFKIKK